MEWPCRPVLLGSDRRSTRCRFGPAAGTGCESPRVRPVCRYNRPRHSCGTSRKRHNPHMIRSHVVVDGSNIATEGRTTPSLRQLDDAVTAFLAEHEVETLTVVVDATFPNRIDPSERAEYEAALLAGELVTPPAGAIGRGDAFILQIAGK